MNGGGWVYKNVCRQNNGLMKKKKKRKTHTYPEYINQQINFYRHNVFFTITCLLLLDQMYARILVEHRKLTRKKKNDFQ